MTSYNISRRQVLLLLAGTVAGAAFGSMLPNITLAGELASLNVGDISVSTFSDGTFDIPHSWFPDASPDVLAAAGKSIKIGVNEWVVRSNDRIILIDTGAGPLFDGVGNLGAVLMAEGIDKKDVTDIIITHMHGDHIGGLMGEDAGGYSKAKIHMSEAEWTYWMDPTLIDKAPAAMKDSIKLQQSIMSPLADRVKTYKGEADLGDGLTLVPLPGHTPGHSGVRIEKNGEELLIIGDAILSEALQFDHPEYTYILDSDPKLAAKTRTDLFNQLADSGKLFAATHLTYPGIGRIERNRKAFKFKLLG